MDKKSWETWNRRMISAKLLVIPIDNGCFFRLYSRSLIFQTFPYQTCFTSVGSTKGQEIIRVVVVLVPYPKKMNYSSLSD